MIIKFRKKHTTLVINICGEIDHHTVEEIRGKIEKEFWKMHGKNIIFNFKEVTFMDSSGIGMIIGRYKHTVGLGGKTAIACANEKVGQIFQLSGLFRIIPNYSTVEEALEQTEMGGFYELR